MTDDNVTRAEEARKRGNELYKQGNLGQGEFSYSALFKKLHVVLTLEPPSAETAYKLAATLAPEDPTPHSNLSSVKFELGQYSAAIDFINKTLKLANDVPAVDEAAQRKRTALYTRLAKSYVYECQFDKAREAIKRVPDGELKSAVDSTIDRCEAWMTSDHSHRKLVLDRVPRYNAHL